MALINKLSNGLTVILEQVPYVESASYSLLTPGGIIHDPANKQGASLILSELISRGAGDLSSRELSDAFENLGIRHSESAGGDRFGLRGSLLGDNIDEALRLVSLMVLDPALPADEIDPIRSVLLQDLLSLKDNPAQRATEELAERYHPEPYSRSGFGTEQGLKSVSQADLKQEWQRLFVPNGAILSVAGKIKPDQLLGVIERHFGAWTGQTVPVPEFGKIKPANSYHIAEEAAQLQVVLLYPSVSSLGEDFYAAKVATSILSGGFSGRLFIEVREKRGLCYSVYASHQSDQRHGKMLCYAGTTPERAQETLDVLVGELRRAPGTITEAELSRAKANLLASVIINEESVASRAAGNAGDYWVRGEVRGLDRVKAEIQKVSIADIDRFFERYPAQNMHLLTLGSRELKFL